MNSNDNQKVRKARMRQTHNENYEYINYKKNQINIKKNRKHTISFKKL